MAAVAGRLCQRDQTATGEAHHCPKQSRRRSARAAGRDFPGRASRKRPRGVVVEQVPKSNMSSNPAVIALLDRAQIDTDTGHREAAGASLERGLRIEPRNAWLWHELAQLRLAQGQYAQAIALARKSISFAARDHRLLALDWRVIGNARVAQGNSAGAEEAFKQATDIEQAVKAEADHGF